VETLFRSHGKPFPPGGTFGPVTTVIPIPPTPPHTLAPERFTGVQNLSGSFSGLSGGSPGGGSMGLMGLAKICLLFAPCEYASVTIPLTPTTGGAGFGIGGTATFPFAVAITMQNVPWTLGQPVMTIRTAT
jgi:hypothetical protein